MSNNLLSQNSQQITGLRIVALRKVTKVEIKCVKSKA